MEDQQRYRHYSFCHTCSRIENRRMKIRRTPSSSRVLMFMMALALYFVEMASAETLCGGELVDALQFVCEDRGFYFSHPAGQTAGAQKGIVEECCFQSCNLLLLEQYCAKPAKSERDVSATSLHVIPVLPPLNKDIPRKPLTVKYSKYEVWQRKAAQRLRRGVPAILRARKFRRQAEDVEVQEQADFHRPLITLPSKFPSATLVTEHHISHK